MNQVSHNSRISYVVTLAVCFVVSGFTYAANNVYILTSEQWNVPREVGTILSMPALQQAMQEYQVKQANQLLIKYPGGDEGTLWAYELRGWLVSLGIASEHIELIPGAAKPGQLEISIIQPK